MKTTTALLRAAAAASAATPALASSSAGEPQPPYVTSASLQDLIKLEDLMAGAQKLQDIADAHGGNRAFGGGGHNATVDWLYDTLSATGYFDVVKQPFVELFSAGSATLRDAAADQGRDYSPVTLTYTAGTDGQTLSRPVVAAANLGCDAADFPAGVAGNIALVKRGDCNFSQKATLAKAAGAVAAIVYNNVEGALAGTLGERSDAYAPTVGISQAEGESILAALSTTLGQPQPLTLDLFIESIVENRTNYNVVAETKQGDKDNVLVLGGHSDSVYAGPGVNDDGSGSVGVLAVALALTRFRIRNSVRFAFWGAEEFGKLGSFYYVKQLNKTGEAEMAKIRAYLNFDMIASPNYVYGIYDGDGSAFNFSGPAGSDQIERDFEDYFKANGLASVPSVFSGRSDYAGFIENGIPSGGIFTGAEVLKTAEEAALFGGEAGVPYDVNYHQAGDTVANLHQEAFLVNARGIANSVAKYAMSWSSLPAVDLPQRRWSADRHRALHYAARRDVAGHGHGHGHAHAHSGPCGQGTDLM